MNNTTSIIYDNSFKDTEPATLYSKIGDEQRRWNLIRSYINTETILEGYVTEARPEDGVVYAVAILEGFEVLIPDSEFITENFFNSSYETASEEEQFKRRFQSLRAAIGSKICYLVKDAFRSGESDATEYTIFGSRTEAMLKKRRYFFFSDELPSDKQIVPGSVVSCKVITTGENGVRAEAFGTDFYVAAKQLSLMHPVLDARDSFSPGDSFYAMVQKVYLNPETLSVKLQVSVRQLEHQKIKDGYLSAHIGSTVAGYVSSFNSERRSYTIVLATGCYASVNEHMVVGGEVLAVGDSVSVQIKERKNGFVTGTCMKISNIARPVSVVYGWD